MCSVLLGCGSDPSGSEGGTDTSGATDTDTETETGVATEEETETGDQAPKLLEGMYTAITLGLPEDTCGGLTNTILLEASNVTLSWIDADHFLLVYEDGPVESTCEVAGDDTVTCSGYSQVLFGFDLVSTTTTFEVVSETSFLQVEALAFTCDNGECMQYDATTPCVVSIDESFEYQG